MTRRKYYSKRKYYRRSNQIDDAQPLAFLITLWIFWIYFWYQKYIKPNLELINFYWKIFLVILWIILIGTFIYFVYKKIEYKKIKKIEQESIPEKLKELNDKIYNFKPLRKYSKEEPYQIELAWYLKNNYTNLNIEVSKNYTRPDIVIDDIAIEIKWPTGMNELKTIPDKIIRYLKEWEVLYIVLFNVQIVPDINKNKELFEEWKKDIFETFESKKDRIFIIER